jgi:hypothetical protein
MTNSQFVSIHDTNQLFRTHAFAYLYIKANCLHNKLKELTSDSDCGALDRLDASIGSS